MLITSSWPAKPETGLQSPECHLTRRCSGPPWSSRILLPLNSRRPALRRSMCTGRVGACVASPDCGLQRTHSDVTYFRLRAMHAALGGRWAPTFDGGEPAS
jgi:hypothetical protein